MSENEAVKCDKCREVITNDEVLSTDEYESLCQDCYDSFIECACCSEVYENAYTSTCHGDPICRDCYNGGDVGHCTSCDAQIILSHGDYYYDDHSGEYCCSDTADCTYLDWTCESCGCEMTFEEANTDHAEQYLCYDCYHNPSSSIQRMADSWIDKADVHTKSWYKDLDDGAKFFLAEFYRSRDEEFKTSNQMIKKGALGAGSDKGWWDGEIEVQSPAFADMAKVIADICYSDLFYVKHKKYGLYHPFRHLFHQCLSYRDRQGSDTVYYNRVGRDDDPQIAFEEVCRDYHRWELYAVRHNKLANMLAENKTEDGANLRKTTSNIMNRSYADRFALLSQRNNTLEQSYQQYLTNAVNQKYKIKIGFDSEVMMDLADFNQVVGSCQDSANRMSYAFGFADMLVNPHLLALIYEDNKIIGRSVIRFWKHSWDDSNEVVKIAPSRLYLSRITNAKADVYVALFKQVNEWAKTVYGIDNYEIIAYSDSRHDSPVYSFIRGHITGRDASQRLNTQVWNTFWHSKPSDDCADYTYYKDEMQRAVYFGQRDGDDYSCKETLPNYGYKTLELD